MENTKKYTKELSECQSRKSKHQDLKLASMMSKLNNKLATGAISGHLSTECNPAEIPEAEILSF